eukprot:5569564-Amphidinium_carterae.1
MHSSTPPNSSHPFAKAATVDTSKICERKSFPPRSSIRKEDTNCGDSMEAPRETSPRHISR